jgi:hypothetical protein
VWLEFAVLTAMNMKVNAVFLGVTLLSAVESYSVSEETSKPRGEQGQEITLGVFAPPHLKFWCHRPPPRLHSHKSHSYFLPSFPSYCTLGFLRIYLFP